MRFEDKIRCVKHVNPVYERKQKNKSENVFIVCRIELHHFESVIVFLCTKLGICLTCACVRVRVWGGECAYLFFEIIFLYAYFSSNNRKLNSVSHNTNPVSLEVIYQNNRIKTFLLNRFEGELLWKSFFFRNSQSCKL